MSANPEKKDEKEEGPSFKEIVTYIQGVGPKTVEKLIEAGFDTVEKLIAASPEELAEAITGLSVAKAEEVMKETDAIVERIQSGELDLSRRKSKRRRAPEPEPDHYELDPAEELEPEVERTSLGTGYERENAEYGIEIGPKWLTRFEKARIIGARALQISMGAPTLLDMSKAPRELFSFAESELKSGLLPMTVRRTLPTGQYADIPLSLLLKHTRLD